MKKLFTAFATLALAFSLVTVSPADEAEAWQQSQYCGPQSMPVYIWGPSIAGYNADNPLDQGWNTTTAINNMIAHLNAQVSGASLYYGGVTYTWNKNHRIILYINETLSNQTAAITYNNWITPTCANGASIAFNDDVFFDSGVNRGRWRVNSYFEYDPNASWWLDWQSVLTHEVMHVYGQGHVTSPWTSTMYPYINWAWKNATHKRSLYTAYDADYFNTLFR